MKSSYSQTATVSIENEFSRMNFGWAFFNAIRSYLNIFIEIIVALSTVTADS